MVGYYVPANESDLAKAFSFVSDETGMIAIHEYADYDRLTADDTILSGIKIFADMTAGVVKVRSLRRQRQAWGNNRL